MDEVYTPEEVEQKYSSTMDSVTLVNTLLEKAEKTTDDIQSLRNNAAHIAIMLTKDFWTTQDLAPLTDAQVAADDWLAVNAPLVDAQSTPEDIMKTVVAATTARLNAFAKTRNYDGILSASTYATSAVEKFRVEGQAAVDLRDQTWAALYAFMAEVQAGTKPMPVGFADVESLLPELKWPEVA